MMMLGRSLNVVPRWLADVLFRSCDISHPGGGPVPSADRPSGIRSAAHHVFHLLPLKRVINTDSDRPFRDVTYCTS